MGWIAIIVLTLLAGAGLSVFVRRDTGALQFIAAALLLALAGYAWQGHPGLRRRAQGGARAASSSPTATSPRRREDMLGRFDQRLGLADHRRRLPAPRRHAERRRAARRARSSADPRQCRPLGRLRQRPGHPWRRHDEPGRPARLPARRRARARPSRRRASSTASRWRRAAITTRPSGSGASCSPTPRPTPHIAGSSRNGCRRSSRRGRRADTRIALPLDAGGLDAG